MRCCSLNMAEKNERESTSLLCLYSQLPNWLIHFRELESMLETKFLQKGLDPSVECISLNGSNLLYLKQGYLFFL